MKAKLIGSAVCLLLSVGAHASPFAHLITGNKLLGFMQGTELQKEAARGYVLGFFEVADEVLFCVPNGFTSGQAFDIARKALEDMPTVRHLPATVILQSTFEERYPCKQPTRKGTGV